MFIRIFEQFIAAMWNRLVRRRRGARSGGGGVDLGFRVVDEQVTRRHTELGTRERMRHVLVLGRTGSGKSYLLRYMCQQDIERDRGFIYFDLHGDATPFLMKVINARERREHRHLSDKLVLIDPSDQIMSVGINVLGDDTPDFVRIAELAEILKLHWGLEHFGARTAELLRNAVFAVAANGLTLVELVPFLTNAAFRRRCLDRVTNPEIRQYFELRYDPASEAMQATMREPILNKTSAFTADPKFRHIVGQPSTFSFEEAMDAGYWIIVNLAKGRLGTQAITLGSLILTMVKNALFGRTTDRLYTVYCDEIQNFIAQASEIETILAEARKTGTGFVSANQFLDQLPPDMRAALFSVGTQVFFQLSNSDATQISQALDGGRPLAERLKNLSQRHAIIKKGPERWSELRVPDIHTPQVDYADLLTRVRYTHGRVRAHVERDIAKRVSTVLAQKEEGPHGWE